MTRIAIALSGAVLALAPVEARACGGALAGAKALEAPRHTVKFRTEPAKIAVGRHFSVDFVVCPKGGGAAPERVGIDAFMPDHRHGMNYKPSVKALGDGRYRAEALMFHMPGRWEFRFDIEGGGASERLSSSMVLR